MEGLSKQETGPKSFGAKCGPHALSLMSRGLDHVQAEGVSFTFPAYGLAKRGSSREKKLIE